MTMSGYDLLTKDYDTATGDSRTDFAFADDLINGSNHFAKDSAVRSAEGAVPGHWRALMADSGRAPRGPGCTSSR
jgi:hypothetical protein